VLLTDAVSCKEFVASVMNGRGTLVDDTDRGKPKYCTQRETYVIALCQPQIPRTCDEQRGIKKSVLYVGINVSSENHTNHINAFCGQNVELTCVRPGGIYNNYYGLQG
jgi:hypothetical protein